MRRSHLKTLKPRSLLLAITQVHRTNPKAITFKTKTEEPRKRTPKLNNYKYSRIYRCTTHRSGKYWYGLYLHKEINKN